MHEKLTVKEREEKLLKKYTEYINQFKVFSERVTELKMFKYAILMKEHILLKGAPGTAKSMMARAILTNIKDSTVFSQQFTAFMDESYVFGPQLLEEFKKGKVKHNIKNSLVDCDFAFLDEFFEANEQLIVSCNEVLNERTFTRNFQKETSGLVTAVITTNRERENEKRLDAVYDRLLFKKSVNPVNKVSNRISMYKNAMAKSFDTFKPLDFSVLTKLIELIENKKIKLNEAILKTYDKLLKEFRDQSLKKVSDRTAIKGLKLLKVSAVLAGRDDINIEDFKNLELILVTDDKEKVIFETEYAKVKSNLEILLKSIEKTKKFRSVKAEIDKVVKNRKNEGYKTLSSVKDTIVEVKEKVLEAVNSLPENSDTDLFDELGDMTDSLEVSRNLIDVEIKNYKKPDKGEDTDGDNDEGWFDDLVKGGN